MDVKLADLASEYLSAASVLKTNATDEEYKRCNKLSMMLAMLLPEDVYTEIVISIANASRDHHIGTATVAVRKVILNGYEGNLSGDHIAVHFPAAGFTDFK